MKKAVGWAVACLVLSTGPLLADEAAMLQQFEPVLSGLTIQVFANLGGAYPCGDPQFYPPSTTPQGPNWSSFFCDHHAETFLSYGTPGFGLDASGNFYEIKWLSDGPVGTKYCEGSYFGVRRRSGTGSETVLRLPTCVFDDPVNGLPPYRTASILNLTVDAVNGDLYIAVAWNLKSNQTNTNPQYYIERVHAILKVSGLPKLLDIILSYQPPSTLSFNVPVRPEGLPGADSFSVYAGDARHASDLSQATPLQCTVPAGRPPIPGEQISVADPLPDPAEGDARYYLAAVNYQGQRRAGRSSINGVLQGRNAAALPGCQ